MRGYARWNKADGSVQYVESHGAKTYYSDLEDLTGTGKVWVSDSIDGMFDMAPENELTQITIEVGTNEKGYAAFVDEYNQHIESEFRKAEDSAPSEFGVGSLFYTPVADGTSWYVVTKVNTKTCDVEWRNFGGDHYVDQVLGYGGRFEIDRIRPLVRSRSALNQMFGG